MKIQNRVIKILLVAFLVSGCQASLEGPANLAQESESAYKKAVAAYQRLISRKKNNASLSRELAWLYFNHGDYSGAIEILENSPDMKAKALLAICFYKSGDYTQALSLFERTGKIPDDQYLYYYGLTCQKHNLYEQALEAFKQIKGLEYLAKARQRINAIQGQSRGLALSGELKKQIEQATQEKYPLAGAVIISVEETVNLLPDNTLVSDSYTLVKILNERGKKDFSEIVIGYDSTYEKVEVESARTIKPSGEITVVGEKDIRDVSRYLNFPLYSNARARIISMPGISAGAVVEYKIKTIQNQLINKKDFDLAYSLQENEPIARAGFRITLPKNRQLKTRVLNSEYNLKGLSLSPLISETQQERVYTWEFKDIPQMELESDMPPVSEINPIMLISTFDSWEEIYKWWGDLAKERMTPDADIASKVNALIKGQKDAEGKIRAIYNYCAQEIRYVGVEYGQAGYQPHSAAEIFKNKYGDCKDKAILFIAMLKAAGIEGYPVLIGTRGTPATQEDFPAVNFNHCIAAVELDGKTLFLDITAEVCSFGDLPRDDQDRRVLVFKKDKYELPVIPLLGAEKNVIRYTTAMKLAPDETVRAQREVQASGELDQAQRYWLRYTPPNLIEQALKEKVQSMVTSGNLIRYNYENTQDLNSPIKLSYEFEGRNFLSRAGSARIIPQLTKIDTSQVAKDTRTYPLELGQPNINESQLIIKLPGNLKVKYLPETLDVKSQWLDYSVGYKLKDQALEITQRQALKKREVSLSEYPLFKQFLEDLAVKADEHIILEGEYGRKKNKR